MAVWHSSYTQSSDAQGKEKGRYMEKSIPKLVCFKPDTFCTTSYTRPSGFLFYH